MATASGRTADALTPPRPAAAAPPAVRAWTAGSVAERLFREPYNFDFFQSVRVLQRTFADRPIVGRIGPARLEPVRFRAHASMNFPPSSIYSLSRPTGDGAMPQMAVAFLGLTGPSGVLPRHYTELLLKVERELKTREKYALRDWFDLFNHRAISLFYRAWEKYRFHLPYERGEYDGLTPDTFTLALRSYVGVGLRGTRDRLKVSYWLPPQTPTERPRERALARVDDLGLLYYAGLLSHRPRSASGLQAILADYFGLPVKVEQFRGQWLQLGRDNQTSLGQVNSQLGVSAVAGERVWDVQGKIRVTLGPLGRRDFEAFLPDRSPVRERKRFYELVHLVRLYVGSEFDFDVQLLLKAPDVPATQMPEATAPGPRLGWNSWVTSQRLAAASGDAVFPGEAVTALNAPVFAVGRV